MSSYFLSHAIFTETGNLEIQEKLCSASQFHGLDPHDSQLQLQTIAAEEENIFDPHLKMYTCSAVSTSAVGRQSMFIADKSLENVFTKLSHIATQDL